MRIQGRYLGVVQVLNEGVDAFNAFLADEYRFRNIVTGDPNTFRDDIRQTWGGKSWPSADHRGVYVLCGYNEASGLVGAYIGKASNQNIGHRIYAHLNRQRSTGNYLRKHPTAGEFQYEAICSIPVRNEIAAGLASALEEFLISLISRDTRGIVLLQKIGNTSRSAGMVKRRQLPRTP